MAKKPPKGMVRFDQIPNGKTFFTRDQRAWKKIDSVVAERTDGSGQTGGFPPGSFVIPISDMFDEENDG